MDDFMKNQFIKVERSLTDLFGEEYIRTACSACAFLADKDPEALLALAAEQTDFYPEAMQDRLTGMLAKVGKQVIDAPVKNTSNGAGTAKFNEALNVNAAPVSASGYYRVGEDGRLYLTTKSEHYHTPMGHSFPGYGLLDKARELNIPNATHNNTRGYITRRLEEELIRTANGLERGDKKGLESVMAITDDEETKTPAAAAAAAAGSELTWSEIEAYGGITLRLLTRLEEVGVGELDDANDGTHAVTVTDRRASRKPLPVNRSTIRCRGGTGSMRTRRPRGPRWWFRRRRPRCSRRPSR